MKDSCMVYRTIMYGSLGLAIVVSVVWGGMDLIPSVITWGLVGLYSSLREHRAEIRTINTMNRMGRKF